MSQASVGAVMALDVCKDAVRKISGMGLFVAMIDSDGNVSGGFEVRPDIKGTVNENVVQNAIEQALLAWLNGASATRGRAMATGIRALAAQMAAKVKS